MFKGDLQSSNCLLHIQIGHHMHWIFTLMPSNKLQWNFNRNSYIFIRKNPFENVVRKTVAILSRPQCGSDCWQSSNICERVITHGYCACQIDLSSLRTNIVFQSLFVTYWLHMMMFAPSQWETSLQSNVVSHWSGDYSGRCHHKLPYPAPGVRVLQRTVSVGPVTMKSMVPHTVYSRDCITHINLDVTDVTRPPYSYLVGSI